MATSRSNDEKKSEDTYQKKQFILKKIKKFGRNNDTGIRLNTYKNRQGKFVSVGSAIESLPDHVYADTELAPLCLAIARYTTPSFPAGKSDQHKKKWLKRGVATKEKSNEHTLCVYYLTSMTKDPEKAARLYYQAWIAAPDQINLGLNITDDKYIDRPHIKRLLGSLRNKTQTAQIILALITLREILDLSQEQASKRLSEEIQNLSALHKKYVNFSDTQKKYFKQLVESVLELDEKQYPESVRQAEKILLNLQWEDFDSDIHKARMDAVTPTSYPDRSLQKDLSTIHAKAIEAHYLDEKTDLHFLHAAGHFKDIVTKLTSFQAVPRVKTFMAQCWQNAGYAHLECVESKEANLSDAIKKFKQAYDLADAADTDTKPFINTLQKVECHVVGSSSIESKLPVGSTSSPLDKLYADTLMSMLENEANRAHAAKEATKQTHHCAHVQQIGTVIVKFIGNRPSLMTPEDYFLSLLRKLSAIATSRHITVRLILPSLRELQSLVKTSSLDLHSSQIYTDTLLKGLDHEATSIKNLDPKPYTDAVIALVNRLSFLLTQEEYMLGLLNELFNITNKHKHISSPILFLLLSLNRLVSESHPASVRLRLNEIMADLSVAHNPTAHTDMIAYRRRVYLLDDAKNSEKTKIYKVKLADALIAAGDHASTKISTDSKEKPTESKHDENGAVTITKNYCYEEAKNLNDARGFLGLFELRLVTKMGELTQLLIGALNAAIQQDNTNHLTLAMTKFVEFSKSLPTGHAEQEAVEKGVVVTYKNAFPSEVKSLPSPRCVSLLESQLVSWLSDSACPFLEATLLQLCRVVIACPYEKNISALRNMLTYSKVKKADDLRASCCLELSDRPELSIQEKLELLENENKSLSDTRLTACIDSLKIIKTAQSNYTGSSCGLKSILVQGRTARPTCVNSCRQGITSWVRVHYYNHPDKNHGVILSPQDQFEKSLRVIESEFKEDNKLATFALSEMVKQLRLIYSLESLVMACSVIETQRRLNLITEKPDPELALLKVLAPLAPDSYTHHTILNRIDASSLKSWIQTRRDALNKRPLVTTLASPTSTGLSVFATTASSLPMPSTASSFSSSSSSSSSSSDPGLHPFSRERYLSRH